jgi:hypothetical protein
LSEKTVKADSKDLQDNYFNRFSDEDRKTMISNLEGENKRLRLQILNNSKLIDMLKKNGQTLV